MFTVMVADLLKFDLSMIFTYSAVHTEMASWQSIYFLIMICMQWLTNFNKSKQDKSFHLDIEFMCLIVILAS